MRRQTVTRNGLAESERFVDSVDKVNRLPRRYDEEEERRCSVEEGRTVPS